MADSAIDTLIAAVQRYAKIEMPGPMQLTLKSTRLDSQYADGWNDCLSEINNQLMWRDDAALGATFEQVLADLQLADSETVEAVRTLRRQRDEAVRREAEAEAVSARLRELAKEVTETLWSEIPLHRKAQLMADGFSLDPLLELCVLVRAPHGEKP